MKIKKLRKLLAKKKLILLVGLGESISQSHDGVTSKLKRESLRFGESVIVNGVIYINTKKGIRAKEIAEVSKAWVSAMAKISFCGDVVNGIPLDHLNDDLKYEYVPKKMECSWKSKGLIGLLVLMSAYSRGRGLGIGAFQVKVTGYGNLRYNIVNIDKIIDGEHIVECACDESLILDVHRVIRKTDNPGYILENLGLQDDVELMGPYASEETCIEGKPAVIYVYRFHSPNADESLTAIPPIHTAKGD